MTNIEFGIPKLDKMLSPGTRPGWQVPNNGTGSLCLVGPQGTGKSVFALHLASKFARSNQGKVYYFSTDFKSEIAQCVLDDFGLQGAEPIRIDSSMKDLTGFVLNRPAGFAFIDLASATAGDDWGLINRLLAVIPTPKAGEPRHLVVIDAIEGLETLVGEHDAFGEISSRRARVALLARLAEKKAHLCMIVEEGQRHQRLAEEFISDVVIRFGSQEVNNYTRRTIEIEKARGHKQPARGRHSFGFHQCKPSPPNYKVVIFPSLHYLNISMAMSKRVAVSRKGCAKFGLPYLDEMLANAATHPSDTDCQGLPIGSTTLLVGEGGTLKSDLCYYFAAGAFRHNGAVAIFTSNLISKKDAVGQIHQACKRLGIKTTKTAINEKTSFIRMDALDRPGAMLMQFTQECIEEAIKKAGGQAQLVRVIIDDLTTYRDVYPDIAADPLYLPHLLQFLSWKGVTSILVATQTVNAALLARDSLDSGVRALIGQEILTWPVDFYGERRVAVSVSYPFTGDATEKRLVVRELKRREDGSLLVDPQFELYADVEKGMPKVVPLQIRLYAETQEFSKYFEEENILLNRLFTPVRREEGVVVGEPSNGYESLRDFCNLSGTSRLDHSLIVQVDEFWKPESGALRSLISYKDTETYDNAHDKTEDPYGIFQPTRHNYPSKKKYTRGSFFSRPSKDHTLPFMWDFGFLMLAQETWINALEVDLPHGKDSAFDKVRKVWDGLTKPENTYPGEIAKQSACGWRYFLEACSEVARHRRTVVSTEIDMFDISHIGFETLSCLVLEIWASEILVTLERNKPKRREFLDALSNIRTRPDEPEETGLIRLLKDYPNELYSVFLILGEVLNFSKLVDRDDPFDLKPTNREAAAVAVRHWYKTASVSPGALYTNEPMVPVRLPGSFSVRGDWFLSVVEGSRSHRLANRALDILSSRRANMARLQEGLGLPVRAICDKNELKTLRTRLSFLGEEQNAGIRRMTLSYKDLLSIGGEKDGAFHWLWRSNLKDYARHSRPFHKWLHRMLLTWQGYKDHFGGNWSNGFKLYDDYRIANTITANIQILTSHKRFCELCRYLISELEISSRVK